MYSNCIRLKRPLLGFLFFILIAGLFTNSCTTLRNVRYFSDLPDSANVKQLKDLNYKEPQIRTDDILSVNIQTADPNSTQVITQGNLQNSAVGASSASGVGGQTTSGYLVDNEGEIEIPVLGKLHVAGLTTEQTRNLIREQASKYYKNPTVNVRFVNLRVTIIGEVNKPGTYVLANERVTLLDALGLAGDMTIYGRRDNVALIRQYDDGRREIVRLDLTKSQVLNSPYYYLRQNDYLYVEPIKAKIVASDAIQNRNIAIATSVLSIVILLFSTIYNHN